jgi:hypothetical protein
VIDDESLVKTRTNTCLSETSGIPSYSMMSIKMLREMGIKDICFVNCGFALFISIYFITVIMDIIRDNNLYDERSHSIAQE